MQEAGDEERVGVHSKGMYFGNLTICVCVCVCVSMITWLDNHTILNLFVIIIG